MSRNFAAGVSTQVYAETLDILDEEFAALGRTVAAITPADWARPSRLRVNASYPYWDVFTLVAHINVATNMIQTLINDTAGGTPSMDHTTFFVTDVAHVARPSTPSRATRQGIVAGGARTRVLATIDEAMRMARATDQAKVARPSSGRCGWTS